MAAPKENKNAEKWSFEDAEAFCNKTLDILISNEKIRTLGGACLKAGGYETLISYLQEKYSIEFESIKKAKEIVKSRLIEQGLDNDVNPTMAIFILKNNHDMRDKTENTNNNTNTNLNTELSKEEVQEINKALDDKY